MVIHFPFSFLLSFLLFFFNATATTEIYTLSLHDALPIYALLERRGARAALVTTAGFEDVLVIGRQRSEEHTSELQSQSNLVCRLLLEKKKKTKKKTNVKHKTFTSVSNFTITLLN